MAEDTVQPTPGFSEHDSGEVRLQPSLYSLEHKVGRGRSFSETATPCSPSLSQQSPVEVPEVLKQHSGARYY